MYRGEFKIQSSKFKVEERKEVKSQKLKVKNEEPEFLSSTLRSLRLCVKSLFQS